MNNTPTRAEITAYFRQLQQNICQALAHTDGKSDFSVDEWTRPEGGGGITRVIQHGNIIEKGGVAFSAVHGAMPTALSQRDGFGEGEFYATGVSLIMHPANPHVPIVHMNVRYFEMSGGRWWFGGGIDLTPHYVDKVQARWFHQQLQAVCDAHHTDFYPRFKQWADDYFYLKHRQETRGVGGIFFDRLADEDGFTLRDRFAFVQSVGNAFVEIYPALMRQNAAKPFTPQEKEWQMLRRGRYVEFNLVYDAGTRFGLETGGRVESILMSLPQMAAWTYCHQVAPQSAEANTLALLKKGIDWVNIA